jgi:hypothetical protein
MKRLVLAVLLAVFFIPALASAGQAGKKKEISKEQVVAVATEAVKGKGFKLVDVQIIYDDKGRLWSERIGKYTELDKSPNFGIFKRGFMKNYKIVYFDYKSSPDLWVFIDKDTGEVLEVFVDK